ncbi:hypothetical protein JCM14202_3595 [Agrilactobacillus composti DSM 18527 = JCM 14202]|uniref:hypothetical protein n=1 Tax=Agrilactobacillus composti TaxID=398555 RepID=UPI00042E0ABE|nr:hypothetical protein [Agrilactobacillus composti]GAF41640.1 hypothetical protein JCM14202_3595 [Agrilactobacillus composti DSM 18527 = JCM 14202]
MGHYPGRQPSPLTKDRRQALLEIVLAALPADMQLMGVNFARGSASSYWLLHQSVGTKHYWLTLRLATHPLWLAHARQLELTWLIFVIFKGWQAAYAGTYAPSRWCNGAMNCRR